MGLIVSYHVTLSLFISSQDHLKLFPFSISVHRHVLWSEMLVTPTSWV